MALNGRLPNTDIATIPGTSRRALRALVPQIAALRDAFEAEFDKPLVITDGYRTYDEQVILKALKGWLAATPGFSNHGWGKALDLGSRVNIFSTAEYNWMKKNGPKYGVYHPYWAEPTGSKPEPWHWELDEKPVPVSNYLDLPDFNIITPTGDVPDELEEDVSITLRDKEEIAASAADLATTKILNYELINGETLGGALASIRNDLIIALNEIASTRRDVQGADEAEFNRDALEANRPLSVADLSPEALEEIATAVANEQARRQRD